MTSGRLVLIVLLAIIIASCSDDNDKIDIIWDPPGAFLYFQHVPAETLYVVGNGYGFEDHNLLEDTCANLCVHVRSYPKEIKNPNLPLYYWFYTVERDKKVEEWIRSFLDPDRTMYTGGMANDVMVYCTEVCKSIRISLYDENNTFMSDLTDQAQFYFKHWHHDENIPFYHLLISSDGSVGLIKFGMTISEYLSYSPMIFFDTYFFFPNLERAVFENGNYVKMEIELDNGTTLTAYTSGYKGQ